MSLAKVVVVIPARYGSTRLPGKPLVLLAGKPMIQRVYERAKLAQRADRVIVATDDQRIVKAVEGFGGEARMTRTEHRTGTERVAEVAAREQREQLRWMENGWKIRVAEVEHDAVSVDVPEDLERVEKLLQK